MYSMNSDSKMKSFYVSNFMKHDLIDLIENNIQYWVERKKYIQWDSVLYFFLPINIFPKIKDRDNHVV